MKNCYKFKSLISNYIDKEISFRDRKFFESHKESCVGCRRLFSSVNATKRQMQAMPNITAGDDFMDSLRTKILNDRNSKILKAQNQGFFFKRVPAFAYGFSSVMVLVIAGFIFLQMPTSGNSTATQMPVAAQKKIEKAKTFQQQFDATPSLLQQNNLANTKMDSGKVKTEDNLQNFENNLNKVDYQKK